MNACLKHGVILLHFLAMGASIENGRDAGKEFQDSTVKGVLEGLKGSTDHKQIFPGYEGTDVPEKDYYDSGANLSDEARIQDNEASQVVNNGMADRPKYNINRETDPLFKRYDDVKEKAHSLTDTYSGCVQIPYGTEDKTLHDEKFCHEYGYKDYEEFSCRRSLEVSCENEDAGKVKNFTLADIEVSGDPIEGIEEVGPNTFRIGYWRFYNRTGHCTRYNNEIKFNIGQYEKVVSIKMTSVRYDDWLDIRANSWLIFRGIGPHQGIDVSGNYPCEYERIWTGSVPDFSSRIRTGTNTIKITNLVHGGGAFDVTLSINRINTCKEKDSWSSLSCDNGYSPIGAELISSRCTRGRETRRVGAFDVTRDCWEEEYAYRKWLDPRYEREELCSQHEAEGCFQNGSECLEDGGGYCKKNRIDYLCPYTVPANHLTLCGEDLLCPDGDCIASCEDGNCEDLREEGRKDATEDFKQAASAMAVADEIAKEFEEGKLEIFKGEGLVCGKELTFGAIDCCKDKGWADDNNLARCKSSEKRLGLAKEAGKTIYIGSWKTGGTLNRRKYQLYCVYPSKIGRIILQQGRPQLGLGFGDKKNPDCSGLSLTQLGQVDFNAIDFSEFYEDAIKRALGGTTPTPEEAQSRMAGKMEDLRERMNQRFPPELKERKPK